MVKRFFEKEFIWVLVVFLIACGEEDIEVEQFLGDVFLNSQEAVETFGFNDYTQIDGSLIIADTSSASNLIVDLEKLSKLKTITGDLIIRGNSSLQNLHGLENLRSVEGDLLISDNNALKNTLGVDGIITMGGDLKIVENHSLDEVNMNNLELISGDVMLASHIRSLELKSLERISGDFYILRTRIPNLMGLVSLRSVGRHFEISNNTLLVDLDGLENFQTIGEILVIFSNSSLVDFCALRNIAKSGGLNEGKYSNSLNQNNPSVSSIAEGNCR